MRSTPQRDPRRRHAAHARHHHQLAGQPDRRADLRRRAAHAGRVRRAAQNIWLVVDLCYEKLIYDPVPHNLPKVLADTCPEQAVICGSASKAYAMTGWRCGWQIGPAAVIAASNAHPEPLDLERHLDHAEGRGRGADRIAGAGDRDARRVPQAARSAARLADRRSAAALPQAGRRVLHVRGHQRRAVGRRLPHLARLGRGAARRAAGRGHAGRGVRRARLRSGSRTRRRWSCCAKAAARLLAFVAKHAPQPADGR